MDLSDLKIFTAVVREGSVTRAAQRLYRVQSNVTTRIRQLEEDVGVSLFIRRKAPASVAGRAGVARLRGSAPRARRGGAPCGAGPPATRHFPPGCDGKHRRRPLARAAERISSAPSGRGPRTSHRESAGAFKGAARP